MTRAHERNLKAGPAKRFPGRNAGGSVMPFIALSVILLTGTLGICSDLMRDYQAVRELKFAAQQAALYALSLSTTAGGVYNPAGISSALLNSSLTINNVAQSGPGQSSVAWSAPVSFSQSDIVFFTNPADNNEAFLRLTARRQGLTALKQFFLPLLFTGLNSSLPASVQIFNTAQTVEVLGQPATRIGAGPPAGQTSLARDGDLYGCAALPLAISYQQFAALVAASATSSSVPVTLDLVSSSSSGSKTSPGHIPAALVNLSATTGSTNYYNSAAGALPVSQLQSQLAYFSSSSSAPSQGVVPPTFVEVGAQLSAFDPAAPAFSAAKVLPLTLSLFNQLPSRYYVLPVIAGSTPNLAASTSPNAVNTVVGFAYARIVSPNISPTSYSVDAVLSVSPPLRNASSAAGMAALSTSSGGLIPASGAIFSPRLADPVSGGVTRRLPGIALAPALSPRFASAQ
ncbi:MAG: hypothetical protein KGS72_26860 [Cyanobacteria bacterium REEB67]|nr:hypothetical protein [Cyanobacteria bacterium REEB67]